MSPGFPSREFDDAVAAVCHGTLTEAQAAELGELLRNNPLARDEYLRRVALHAQLASVPGLFEAVPAPDALSPDVVAFIPAPTPACPPPARGRSGMAAWWRRLALAAALAALLGTVWWFRSGAVQRRGETSRAVAMLNRVVGTRWDETMPGPRLGAPLEPGPLKLESGLAQIVFYNGARVVIEGPAELQLISSTEAVCTRGTLTAEVPPQARGFRIISPRLDVTDLGTEFGLRVNGDRTELHVFEGQVEYRAGKNAPAQDLAAGRGAVVDPAGNTPRLIAANPAEFAGLFDLQAKSVAAEARRYDQWRESIRKLQRDPSLWVHLDFEHGGAPTWRLPNSGSRGKTVPDATIVGCEWRDGRWATKPALEFRGVSDRVRVNIPGDLESMTLAAWVRVQGLDRTINSLFMSDGFLPGTLHWVIRHDGVLGLTVIGNRARHQILASPPVLTFDQFGIWTHLAVVLDARARQVVHYVNGRPVSRHQLEIPPPFRFGTAELGNWNVPGNPGNDPFLVRNFSGAIDEFCLFNRALSSAEIGNLHADGKRQAETLASAQR